MLIFLYGDDDYRSKKTLKQIKDKYLDASATDANLSILDAEEEKSFEKIASDIEAMPFLAKTRLIILYNFLSKSKKYLQDNLKDYLDKIPETSVVIFWEESVPDKRSGLYKTLGKKANKKNEFSFLNDKELESWISKKVEKEGGQIEPSAISKLASYVGPNLWQMENEIEKLILYKKPEIIKSEDVELMVKAKLNDNIFNLIDAIGYKDVKKAIKLLNEILESGQNEIYVLTMIIYQFRNLLIIKDLLSENSNQFWLSKKSGIHPFVVKKSMWQAQKFDYKDLKKIYDKLQKADLAIKTGQIEPEVALDLLLMGLAK